MGANTVVLMTLAVKVTGTADADGTAAVARVLTLDDVLSDTE